MCRPCLASTANADAWSDAYSSDAGERFIPIELWTGMPWDGYRNLAMTKATPENDHRVKIYGPEDYARPTTTKRGHSTCSKGTPPSVTPISSHWRAGAIRTWAVFSPRDPQTAARAYCICLATGQRLYSHCLSMPVSTYGQHLQGQPEFSARSRPILRKFCIPCHLNHRQDVPERLGLAAGASLGASLYGASHLGQMIFFCLRS